MRNWAEATGEVIAAIGGPTFAARLCDALRSIVPYDYMVIFGYIGSARPLDLYDTFPADKRRVFVEDYQAGPYLLDPFFLGSREKTSGLYRLRDLAPDRFYQGEYFRNYYVQTGLAEEIGYFVPLPDEAKLVVSLMRAEKAFSAKEFRDLDNYWPVICAAAGQHWKDLARAVGESGGARHDAQINPAVERAFHAFGDGVLTPREREVVEYTLKGHSAEAVGRILGVASGTVRIHRRNIYAKLRISSQGELFSQFIGTLSQAPSDDDA